MHRSTDDLLYDSEAALRLVDTALHELHGAAAEPDREPAIEPDPRPVPGEQRSSEDTRRRAAIDIVALLDALRECRAMLDTPPRLAPISQHSLHSLYDHPHPVHRRARIIADGGDAGMPDDA